MIARLRDLFFTPHPYERNVLLWLAAFRAGFTGTAAVTVWVWTGDWLNNATSMAFLVLIARPVLTLLAAIVASVVSADFIEHYAKRWLLGYVYNPRVMAAGEWEGWTGYLDEAQRWLWWAHKRDVLYYKDQSGRFLQWTVEGDPGSGQFGDE